jgi:LEA14-like dessication related protein
VFIGPEFEISITQSWGRVAQNTTQINTVIAVNNPTPLSRWLKKIEFDLYINGLKIASEVFKKSVEIKPLGKTEILLTSFLNNSKIPDLWITYLKKDDFNVTLAGNVTFSSTIREIICPIGYKTCVHTPLLELLNIRQPRELRVGPTTLILKSLNLTWGEITSVQTKINSNAVIYNPNSYPVTIKKINYTIEMNGIKMGEGRAKYDSIVLEAKIDNNVWFVAVLNNTMLDDWWATHLRNDQVTNVAVKLLGVAEVSGMDYSFIIAEVGVEASICILSGTTSYGFFLPIL